MKPEVFFPTVICGSVTYRQNWDGWWTPEIRNLAAYTSEAQAQAIADEQAKQWSNATNALAQPLSVVVRLASRQFYSVKQ